MYREIAQEILFFVFTETIRRSSEGSISRIRIQRLLLIIRILISLLFYVLYKQTVLYFYTIT